MTAAAGNESGEPLESAPDDLVLFKVNASCPECGRHPPIRLPAAVVQFSRVLAPSKTFLTSRCGTRGCYGVVSVTAGQVRAAVQDPHALRPSGQAIDIPDRRPRP